MLWIASLISYTCTATVGIVTPHVCKINDDNHAFGLSSIGHLLIFGRSLLHMPTSFLYHMFINVIHSQLKI